MNIVEVPIDDLKMYDNNPRKNAEAVQFVKNSIAQFGFKVPLVIDKDYTIVCGHTRYKAARALKMGSLPCVIADDLSEDEIKAFRLADNKTAEMAGWDYEKLEWEFQDLDSSEFDLADFGFFPTFDTDNVDEFFKKDEKDDEDDSTVGIEATKTCCCPKCGHTFEVK